jgi:hypothetical protein
MVLTLIVDGPPLWWLLGEVAFWIEVATGSALVAILATGRARWLRARLARAPIVPAVTGLFALLTVLIVFAGSRPAAPSPTATPTVAVDPSWPQPPAGSMRAYP